MKDAVQSIAERIKKNQQFIQTEEATKTAFIMPFLQLLGYDVFNPTEVVPEFTADVGIKEGEKVDYAIVLNGQPEILIECKMCGHELNAANENQLLRYFHASKAKFGILTNGVVYKFYTDLAEPNKMVMVSDENGIKAGADVASAKVTGTVVKQDKAKKIIVFKYKAKKNERKKQGHRQPFTAVKIEKIEL